MRAVVRRVDRIDTSSLAAAPTHFGLPTGLEAALVRLLAEAIVTAVRGEMVASPGGTDHQDAGAASNGQKQRQPEAA